MPKTSLLAYSTLDDLAKDLRAYILQAQTEAFQRHERFRVAVSGGSLPKTLAKALLSGEKADFPFDKWDIFFADERIVPLDHEDSNYKVVMDEWVNHIPEGSPKPVVHAIDTTVLDDPTELADRYEQDLVKEFAQRDSVRIPMFDLILLGCGPDGHTCSLFPGHPLLLENEAWILSIADSPKPPPGRITFSLPVASHGIKIAFVATGAGKKEIIKKIFDTEEGAELPSGRINKIGGERVTWFVDEPAVEGVVYPRTKGAL